MAPLMSNPSRLRLLRESYNQRTPTYNALTWHHALARDFITWATPPLRPGASVLDLCSGSGLVTLAAAAIAGPTGHVVAIDIAEQFQALARTSAAERGLANIEFLLGDVGDLDAILGPSGDQKLEEVKEKGEGKWKGKRGGFDVITCCSALVLLPDPSSAIKSWSKHWLAPGGVLLVDVITEFSAREQLLAITSLEDAGLPVTHSRVWVTGPASVEALVKDLGPGFTVEVFEPDQHGGSYHTYEVDLSLPETYWDRFLENPINVLARGAERERIEVAKRKFLDGVRRLLEEEEGKEGKEGIITEVIAVYVLRIVKDAE